MILGYIILVFIWIFSAPFIVGGYVANHISVFWYYGWSKASKHQAYLVNLKDKKDTQS